MIADDKQFHARGVCIRDKLIGTPSVRATRICASEMPQPVHYVYYYTKPTQRSASPNACSASRLYVSINAQLSPYDRKDRVRSVQTAVSNMQTAVTAFVLRLLSLSLSLSLRVCAYVGSFRGLEEEFQNGCSQRSIINCCR